MEIRDAQPADLPAILVIHNDAVENSTAIWSEEKADLAEREAWLAERRAGGFPVLVAIVDGENPRIIKEKLDAFSGAHGGGHDEAAHAPGQPDARAGLLWRRYPGILARLALPRSRSLENGASSL